MLNNKNIILGEYRDNDNNKFLFEEDCILIEMYYDTGDILKYKYVWENNKFVDKIFNESFKIEYYDKNKIILVYNESLYLTLHLKNLKK
tara:strand:+ start:1060 stop:1326 length:267 start_codon:yes stop_codon:yes gene_type:complete